MEAVHKAPVLQETAMAASGWVNSAGLQPQHLNSIGRELFLATEPKGAVKRQHA